VDIHVLQGERELATDNISLGKFQLNGIPPLPRGTPKIEVSFDVDVDGIVHVSATDLLTENTQTVKIISSKGLSPQQIQRMIEGAETSAEEDKRRRELTEAGIAADNTIRAAEILIEESQHSSEEAQTEKVWKAILKVKEALASGQSEEIRCRSAELRELLGKIHCEVRNSIRQMV